jgi:hypothetical protein
MSKGFLIEDQQQQLKNAMDFGDTWCRFLLTITDTIFSAPSR